MELKLRAGTPNDANRDYVPLGIPGTDMTVNENGNNSQVYPERLREYTGVLADGETDIWYEYVPKSYDGSKPVPLVVSNHGGLMSGWAQAVYSSWTLLAEREGFICVFPNAHALQMWTLQGMMDKVRANPELVLPIPADPEDWHDNHDVKFVKALIEHMQEKYRIDPGRIYMHGMSMGHMMTDQFARFYGYLLAGAGGSLYYLAGNTEFFWNTYQSLPAAGFNGIAVALLAVNNPIAVIFTGCFMSMLNIAGLQIKNLTGYNEYITDVIIAVIVYLSAFSLIIKMWLGSRQKKAPAAQPAAKADSASSGDAAAKEGDK